MKTYCEANCGSNHACVYKMLRLPRSTVHVRIFSTPKCASFAALFIELHCLLHCISYSIMHGNFVPLRRRFGIGRNKYSNRTFDIVFFTEFVLFRSLHFIPSESL